MPERPRVVVVNTTPLISLAIIKRLDLLRQLYGEVLIPPAVEKEVMAGGQKSGGYVDLSECPFVRTVPLKDPSRADLPADLHGGEAEAIALAQELNADLVIIDERLGRAHAKRLGLQLTGVVGVLLRAKKSGVITTIGPLLRQLASISFRSYRQYSRIVLLARSTDGDGIACTLSRLRRSGPIPSPTCLFGSRTRPCASLTLS